jgi:parvulin-like peptidyl-prolyl isomerase
MTEAAKIYEEDFIARNTDETLKYFEENNLDKDYVTNRIAIEQLVGSFIQKLQDDYLDSDGFVEKEKTLNLVRASHILVNTQEEALEIKGLINEEPSRFEMLAKERSTCASAENEGDLGYFEATDMAEEFSKAAFAMEIDEISEVVASQFGYHIIKLTDKGTLFEILERGSEDPYLDQKLLDLSYQVVGEKLKNLYDEQLLKTPIQYYSIEE